MRIRGGIFTYQGSVENMQGSKRAFCTAQPGLLMAGELCSPLAAPQPGQTPLSCSCVREVDVPPSFITLTVALVTRADQNLSGNGDAYNDIFINKIFLHLNNKK